MLDDKSLFGIANFVFSISFVNRKTYISNVLNQVDINKYNLFSVDVNKDHFMYQEND